MSYGHEMTINPTKEKRLTNFRMTGHEEQIKISDPKVFSIEEALGIIQEDEYLEVTKDQLRIRKKELEASQRKRVK